MRTEPRRWPRWVPIAGWSVLGILGAALLVFIATVTFGAVHGTEFCPQTFERRSYSYFELPLVRIQLTGEIHEDLTGGTEKTVQSKNYLLPATGPRKDWHVLAGSRGSRVRQPGNAGLLIQYLDATEVGANLRWENWTEEHPELAKIVWPAVQQLALREQYVYVPDAFDLTKTIDQPAELKAALDQLVAKVSGPQGASK